MALQYGLNIDALMDFFCEGEHAGFTEREIKEAEQAVGAALPAVYRNYLKTYGRDAINARYNRSFNPPDEIFTTYQAIEEELGDWEPEFQDAVREGRQEEYKDIEYFTLWQLPVEKWNTVTENYVIVWTENQGVWHAGYLRNDLLDGQPDPPVYISTNDDFITFQKMADTEQFLMEMLRQAAYGYHNRDLERYTKPSEIKTVLADNNIDLELLRSKDSHSNIGTCFDTDTGRLYFYYEEKDYQELYFANKTKLN